MASPRPLPLDRSAASADAGSLSVRPLESVADLRACVALQREIWGATYDEIVPASLLRASLRVGGVALGAIGPGGELVGFVFGLTGLRQGEVVHWSHMLGVLPTQRDRGIGRRLKEAQRAELAERGVARMYWTFDPLQARNAHLNIDRLGARVIEYVANMYGESRSPLHQAGTDRMVVECATSPDPAPRPDAVRIDATTPVLTPVPRAGDVLLDDATPASALIEIPWDLQELAGTALPGVAEWRAATRQYFQWALASGYVVRRLQRDPAARRIFYVIERAAE